MNNKIVLDLETKKTFDEVGGHHKSADLGISVCGIYSYGTGQYQIYKEHQLNQLLPILQKADLIIGFNSKSFDFTVLQPYYPNFKLSALPHLDIMEEIVHALGFRLKLESVAQETLGYGKSGDGLDAIRFFRSGQIDKLMQYCLDDVKITKEVYDYGLAHGNLWFSNSGKRESIPIRWQQGQSINDLINNALRKGEQLEIDYIDDNGQVSKVKVDVQSIKGNKLKVFSHNSQSVQVFDISKIKTAKAIGQMANWQKGLF